MYITLRFYQSFSLLSKQFNTKKSILWLLIVKMQNLNISITDAQKLPCIFVIFSTIKIDI